MQQLEETQSKQCNQIICVDRKPEEHGKLFFGEYGKFIRIDRLQFPQFQKLYEASESNTWFINEIDYSKDIVGWQKIPQVANRMFQFNNSYQALMDAGVTNIFEELSKIASVPELQYLYKRISVEESIHALTYSNGLNIVFGSEAEYMLDIVYRDPVIKTRMNNEIDGSNDFIELCINQKRQDDEAKMSILMLLGISLFLEGVKFPFSFFVTWSINKAYENAIQGFARAIKLIAWDEMTVHTVVGATVLNILRKDESQGFSHLFEEFDEKIVDFAKKTAESEMEWSEYLLKDGPIPGYNKEIGEHFIKYWTDRRLKDIGLKPMFNEKKSDVIDWYNKYRNLNGTTTALQEANATNYQKGKLVNDLDKFDLDTIELG